ncbi:MAG: hypothetical protein WCF94_01025 [bacterium]
MAGLHSEVVDFIARAKGLISAHKKLSSADKKKITDDLNELRQKREESRFSVVKVLQKYLSLPEMNVIIEEIKK